MSVLIQFENVVFRYKSGDPAVVNGLTFDVEPGEFLAITGPSGCGKSTILMLMAGLKKPNEGRVLFRGKDLAAFTSADEAAYLNRDIGMIYQFFNLITDISAVENVMAPALIAGKNKTEARQKALALLASVRLEKKARTKVSRLSGGEQQRVAIARAFMNEPQLILADEPTGNLDHASSDLVMDMLCAEQRNRGCALVVVTHDQQIASRADSLIELV